MCPRMLTPRFFSVKKNKTKTIACVCFLLTCCCACVWQYWDKVNADQEAAKAGQGSTAAPVASSLGARNVKAQFEQRNAAVNQVT